MIETLTDVQCDEFRRLPLSFNDMVRAIYQAGREAPMASRWAEATSGVADREKIAARLDRATTQGNFTEVVVAAQAASKALRACTAQGCPEPVQADAPGETDRLRWCSDCGEGVTTFCRGRKINCAGFPIGRDTPQAPAPVAAK